MTNFLYKNLIRAVLFKCNPEFIHETIVNFSAFFQKSDFACSITERFFNEASKPIEKAGLKFKNAIGLAAGFDKDAKAIKFLSKLGFGFIEAGTITFRPQKGNPKPRLYRFPKEEAIINRMGFNNVGAMQAAKNIEKSGKPDIPLGINIGKNADCPIEEAALNYLESFKILYPLGDYFTLNISSPNTKDLRKLHNRDNFKRLLEKILNFRASKKEIKPIFIKISPDLEEEELEEICAEVQKNEIGLIAANTTIRRDMLKTKGKKPEGGLSGKPLEEISNKILEKTRSLTGPKVPIIASGGILSPESAKKKFKLGADLVQIYTGLIYQGPFFAKDLIRYINSGNATGAY